MRKRLAQMTLSDGIRLQECLRSKKWGVTQPYSHYNDFQLWGMHPASQTEAPHHVDHCPLSLCSRSIYVFLEARFYWLRHHSTLGTPVGQSSYQIILGVTNFPK